MSRARGAKKGAYILPPDYEVEVAEVSSILPWRGWKWTLRKKHCVHGPLGKRGSAGSGKWTVVGSGYASSRERAQARGRKAQDRVESLYEVFAERIEQVRAEGSVQGYKGSLSYREH
jgi:hypothetical protein